MIFSKLKFNNLLNQIRKMFPMMFLSLNINISKKKESNYYNL